MVELRLHEKLNSQLPLQLSFLLFLRTNEIGAFYAVFFFLTKPDKFSVESRKIPDWNRCQPEAGKMDESLSTVKTQEVQLTGQVVWHSLPSLNIRVSH